MMADATGPQASLPATPWLPRRRGGGGRRIIILFYVVETTALQAGMPAVQSHPPYSILKMKRADESSAAIQNPKSKIQNGQAATFTCSTSPWSSINRYFFHAGRDSA